MLENSNGNNKDEKEPKKEEDNNNKVNISFSQVNNSIQNSNTKNINNNNHKIEVDKEKEIRIKKSVTKGKILGGQFIIGEEVGKGTFGVVRIATHIITGEKVAVKMLYKHKIKEDSDKKRLEKEIKILKILRHNNIVQLYNVFQTSSTIYLVMEYIKGKELFEIIVHKKRLSELESLRFFQQLISGIEYLGKIRVAHRDLKPENLLIDSKNNLKIADFGLSNMYKNNELLSTACGSPCYAAPEMLAGEKYFGLSADIWSSGIILYTMLCGRLPFEDKNNENLYKKIREGNFTTPDFLSENAKDFLHKILNVDPKKRYTISQIKKHPWFNQLDQRKYMSKGLLLNKFVVPIDEDIVNKMENEYEYNSKEIRLNLLRNKHNHITTTYYLILKKKIKKGISSVCDMSSSEFYNYIHNPKNLLISYNGDWNKILKERGLKKKVEKSLTYKSNSSQSNSIKNDNKVEINNDIINNSKENKNNNNNFDENNILLNNKSEEFLIEKNENKNEENEIKAKFAFENKNNGFKEKIDEMYKQKNQNNSKLNLEENNMITNDNENTIDNNIININNEINNTNNEVNNITNEVNKITNEVNNITNENNNITNEVNNITDDNNNITNDNNNNITNDNNNDQNNSEQKIENKKDSIKDNKNISRKFIQSYKDEKIISINLEDINKKSYTPSSEKEFDQSTNIYVNTISFLNNSNKKNLINVVKKKTSNSKIEPECKKYIKDIPKFKQKNKNSKSAEKGKNKKKIILININKVNIENKIKNEFKLNTNLENKTTTAHTAHIENSRGKKNLLYHKTNANSKIINSKKDFIRNSSSKNIYFLKNNIKRISSNNIKRYSNSNINYNNRSNKHKSVARDMIRIDKNKKLNLSGINKIDKININVNKLSNKMIPSFTINKNKISYKENTNYSKKISIEGIYYAHKKNLQEINKIYNKILNQTKINKKIENKALKKFSSNINSVNKFNNIK